MAKKTTSITKSTPTNNPATATTETSAEVTTQAGEKSPAEVVTTPSANVETPSVTEQQTPPAGGAAAAVTDVVAGAKVATSEAGNPPHGDEAFEITSIPDRGFWRAGQHWTPDAQRVLRSDFTDDQWAALIAEPNINIKRV